MRQNLEDIARLSGVSRSTVSRVVNQHPNVSARTREKVLEIIREQNYRPNPTARALAMQQSRTISVVIPQAVTYAFGDPYYALLIQGIMAKANEFDYAVMLWLGDSNEEENRFGERVLNHTLVDGLVITAAASDDPLIPHLAKAGFPFVVIGPPQVESLNYVDVDNVRGAQLAVSHLIHLGWGRIGTITGPMYSGAAQARLKGYRLALERAGRPIDEKLIAQGAFDEVSGYVRMRYLLQRGVDAVFAASDMMAVGALRAIHEQGLRVPDDIGLVGFDDQPFAAATAPPLTTVRQPIQDLGATAMQVLIDLLNGDHDSLSQIILPAQLIVRDTCGATRI